MQATLIFRENVLRLKLVGEVKIVQCINVYKGVQA